MDDGIRPCVIRGLLSRITGVHPNSVRGFGRLSRFRSKKCHKYWGLRRFWRFRVVLGRDIRGHVLLGWILRVVFRRIIRGCALLGWILRAVFGRVIRGCALLGWILRVVLGGIAPEHILLNHAVPVLSGLLCGHSHRGSTALRRSAFRLGAFRWCFAFRLDAFSRRFRLSLRHIALAAVRQSGQRADAGAQGQRR